MKGLIVNFLVFGFFFTTNCENKAKVIQKGDLIEVDFVLLNSKNRRIDDSKFPNNTSLIIMIGNNEWFNMLDDSLIGLKKGDVKKFVLKSEDHKYHKGVHYLIEDQTKEFIINKNETLFLEIEVLKIF
jgi:FKBP-type peptidyl-prolyl cis-trans isomerase 2